MKQLSNIKELKSIIKNEINFTGNKITSINGINLQNRTDLPELKVTNNYVYIETYTPFGGHKTEFISSPFIITIN
jgi:hypothetical protein